MFVLYAICFISYHSVSRGWVESFLSARERTLLKRGVVASCAWLSSLGIINVKPLLTLGTWFSSLNPSLLTYQLEALKAFQSRLRTKRREGSCRNVSISLAQLACLWFAVSSFELVRRLRISDLSRAPILRSVWEITYGTHSGKPVWGWCLPWEGRQGWILKLAHQLH